ncbi:MAG: hypothetical protein IPJ51_20110 [Saprospiraceae bacterium]|nr:hypothetical protein [Saprospiraceae bacterium]
MNSKFYNIIPIAFEGYEKLDNEELMNFDVNTFADFKLVVNDWPLDYFFDNSFTFIVDERLYSIISYQKISGVRFKKISYVEKGPDFDIYPEDTVLPNFREVVIIGTPFRDDFGIYKLPIGDGYFIEYLVASEKGVKLLVLNNCIELRGEIIEGNPDNYFLKNREIALSSNASLPIFPRFEQKQFLRD